MKEWHWVQWITGLIMEPLLVQTVMCSVSLAKCIPGMALLVLSLYLFKDLVRIFLHF